MQLVLVYDIPDDRRRARLFKTMKRFGTPVQYSVFECDLSPREIVRMEKAVRAVIEASEDNVRCYRLCRYCSETAQMFGGQPLTQKRKVYVV